MRKTNDFKTLCLFISVIGAVILVLLYSYTTSPFYHWTNFDSSVYRVMGWLTSEGGVPYKDMFDHKGPFFVLVETVGHQINKSFGITVIQIITWFFTFWGTVKILSIFFDSKRIIFVQILSIGIYIFLYYLSGGNYVEEYCLPFIVWSYVFLVKYLVCYKTYTDHNPKYALFYGISFTVCAFTKLSNAIPLCATVLVVICVLIANKRWKNLLKNALMFLLGIIIFALPFVIWFAAKGALWDMIYASFVFNFKYMGYYHPKIDQAVLIKSVLRYLSLFIISLILLWFNKKNKSLNIAISLQLLTGIIFFFSGAKFLHYLIIWIPSIIIAVCIGWTSGDFKKVCNILVCVISIYVFLMIGISVNDCHKVYISDRTPKFEKEIDKVISRIPIEDRNSVVALNTSAHIYFYGKIKPIFKHFVLQDFHSNIDKKIEDYCVKALSNKKAKYIIVEKIDNKKMKKIVQSKYESIIRTRTLKLFKAKGK